MPLVVCDVCWQLADGHDAELALTVGEIPSALADTDPTADARAAAHVWHDEAGVIEGTLLRCGIRQVQLRWIPRSVMWQLWQQVSAYVRPEGTRACWEGSAVWLAEVVVRIAGQAWQPRRKDTYLAAAEALAGSCLAGQRPLTRITVDAIAERIGRTDRTVRTILAWLTEQKLLGRVLGGTRTRTVTVPHDETDEERFAREAREAALQERRRERQAEKRAQARAEIASLRTGRPLPPWFEAFVADGQDADDPADDEQGLLSLASVFELLVPTEPEPQRAPAPRHSPTDPANTAPRGRQSPQTRSPGPHPKAGSRPSGPRRRDHRAQRTEPGSARPDQRNFRPNGVSRVLIDSPVAAGAVDKPLDRGASRRQDPKSSQVEAGLGGPNQSRGHRSAAERAAARLLGRTEQTQPVSERLPWQIANGVSVCWLAAQIRPLVAASWSDAEIVWHITTGGGRFQHVPRRVPNPRGFICRAISSAVPAVRPTVKLAVAELEAEHAEGARRRCAQIATRQTAREREQGRRRAAEIAACQHCDSYGWIALDGGGPEVRCDHPADQPAPAAPSSPALPETRQAALADLKRQHQARELQRKLVEQARAATGRQPFVAAVPAVPARPADEIHARAVERARGERGLRRR